MNEQMRAILESKRLERSRLAALSFSAKISLLETLRDRALAIENSTLYQARGSRAGKAWVLRETNPSNPSEAVKKSSGAGGTAPSRSQSGRREAGLGGSGATPTATNGRARDTHPITAPPGPEWETASVESGRTTKKQGHNTQRHDRR